jgi:hypothetical protein
LIQANDLVIDLHSPRSVQDQVKMKRHPVKFGPAEATVTPSDQTDNRNVYVRAQFDSSSRVTAASNSNGVLGNTNRRYYFNSSANANPVNRPFVLTRPHRSHDNRIATLPPNDSTVSSTRTPKDLGVAPKSKRSSPIPALLKLVSKSSDYLERKLQSIHRSGSTHELLGAANLGSNQDKPIRSVRKKSLDNRSKSSTASTDLVARIDSDPILTSANVITSNRIERTCARSIPPTPIDRLATVHQPLSPIDSMQSIESSFQSQSQTQSVSRNRAQQLWRAACNVMRQQGRQIAIAAVLLFSIWNAFGNDSSLKTRLPPSPRKLFPIGSPVIDFELGSVQQLSQLASQREATFVVYYAPWDAECQRFKRDYETIAGHFADQMTFAAVNCWWPDGECGKSFKIKRYPVLLAYLRGVGEVEYRGPLVVSYLISFLDHLLNPLERLVSAGDLLHLRAKHDGVVVAYFDFDRSIDPPGYGHFLHASIKALHSDPWRRVQFAIVSSLSLANKLQFEKSQQVQIHTWNDTVIYGGQLSRVDNFVKWVHEIVFELNPPLVEWITASGKKSDTLISKLSQGPTLLLFTPRSLVLGISPYFEVVRLF